MISASTSAFIFAMMRAGFPALAFSASLSTISVNRFRMFFGAIGGERSPSGSLAL